MDVPEVVVNRLPQYVRALRQLLEDGSEIVSSQLLGQTLQMTPAQIAEAQQLSTEIFERIQGNL